MKLIGTEVDEKTKALAGMIYRLRQDLGVFWLLDENAQEINAIPDAASFLEHVQWVAQRGSALAFCSIYERPNARYDQYSIRGIIDSLRRLESASPSVRWSQSQCRAVREFLRATPVPVDTSLSGMLDAVVNVFVNSQECSLTEFRTLRDKAVAHPELGPTKVSLPGFCEQMALYGFASDFYELVCGQLVEVGPALMSPHAENSLIEILKKLGVQNPRRRPFTPTPVTRRK